MNNKYWLLKAEPDSRIVKGKDVKFSVDDFEAVKTSPWEGVRNYEARNLMKEMAVGDQALFYHSNCKNPGIAAFAEVSKEAYPDYTAWDPSHPYYDPKTDKVNPRWYMVDLTYKSRAPHFIPLSLLKRIADSPPDRVPPDLSYIGLQGCKSIKEMNLVTRGRLSVQRVSESAWNTIQILAETGGWDDNESRPQVKKKGTQKSKTLKRTSATSRGAASSEPEADGGGNQQPENGADEQQDKAVGRKRKRKQGDVDGSVQAPLARKSSRPRKKPS
ncbi:hypothetical protein AX17_002097 [Amanita inopinata Kibby_2008]|nr:hypothetical protein AX17_002097 [Amanita inopinata Kibby_2008]